MTVGWPEWINFSPKENDELIKELFYNVRLKTHEALIISTAKFGSQKNEKFHHLLTQEIFAKYCWVFKDKFCWYSFNFDNLKL